MNKSSHFTLLSFAALASLALGLLAPACAGQQPTAPCVVARSGTPFLMVWTMNLQKMQVSDTCQAALADFRSSELYSERFGSVAGENMMVAIRPDEFAADEDTGAPLDADPSHPANALGAFESNDVSPNGICTVNFVSPAIQTLPDADGNPVTVSYDFVQVLSLSDAAHGGTQIAADLVYSRGDCTAEFDGIGINPSVACTTDADCSPNADYSVGRVSGSGLLADYPVKCQVLPGHESDDAPQPMACLLQGTTFPVLAKP